MNPLPPSGSDAARPLATLLHLLRRARDAESEHVLGFVMVNETINLLPYRQAALWRGGPLGRIVSLSGLAEVDATAPHVQWLAAVCKVLPAGMPLQRVTAVDLPPVLAADWGEWLPANLLFIRLELPGIHADGALLLARDAAWSDYELTLAAELAHGYAHAQARFAPERSWRDRVALLWQQGKNRRRLLLLLLVLACFPVRLSVLARSEVTPQEAMLMRAPLAGVIDRIEVQPNQPVTAGAPLFSLDSTVLAGQLALASTAQEAAAESFRQQAQLAVTEDKARLEMAGEQARLEQRRIETEYTSRQLARIHVKAPRDGVIVFSDRNDWLGRAVAPGERVMQLADPGRVELTAWLPASEAIHVAPGSKLRLFPNAAPTESYDAVITRVAYRAEVGEDNVLAYRVYARFSAGQPLPRIGQMGTARIYGSWVPLSYYSLRRPLTWLRQWVGW